MELIGIILIIGFFYLMKTDFSSYPDSYKDYRRNTLDEEHLAQEQALKDMSNEDYPTSLLKYDNFFKETYW